MTQSALDRARLYQDELTAIRRDIHAHPELGLEEYRTAELVAAKLEEWGIEVHRGVGKTGVVGVLRNGNGDAAVGLRADMDALPILEATGLPHASQNPGRMHACGHDGHTTMLLGAFFDIVITGKGAHGAHPSQSIDPILVACHLGTALQSIVSRNVSAMDTAVLSITRIQSGDAYNVIPQSAIMAGTVRTMKSEVMALIEQNMRRLATSVAAGFGAEATIDFRVIFAPMVNNTEEAIAYGDAASELVGEENVRRDGPPGMGSEDFSFMMEQVPGAHINLGNGDTAALHNHLYDFNDETIPYGVALYGSIVEKKLPKGAAD